MNPSAYHRARHVVPGSRIAALTADQQSVEIDVAATRLEGGHVVLTDGHGTEHAIGLDEPVAVL